jgi:hypothetical protein
VEGVVVLGADAHHVGDQAQGQRHRDGLDEVALASTGHRVDRVLHDLPELDLELADHAGREALVDEPAQLGVPGLALVDQAELDRVAGQDTLGGGEELLVLGAVVDVRVLRDHPDPGLLGPEDRIVLAEPAEALAHLLLDPDVRVQEVDVDLHEGLLGGQVFWFQSCGHRPSPSRTSAR